MTRRLTCAAPSFFLSHEGNLLSCDEKHRALEQVASQQLPGSIIVAGAIVNHSARFGERRILIVDDSPSARTCIRQMLSPFKWRMDEAGDGAAAFGMILEDDYDLLITDLRMSPVSGEDLIAAVRLLADWRRPRILVCSAEIGGEWARLHNTIQLADATASKPFDPVALTADVVRLMTSRPTSG